MNLDKFFNPKSIAVIGASSDSNKVGYALMANVMNSVLDSGRRIFPVTLSEKEVLGLPAFISVKDIPEQVDLAVIAVRADFVPQILKDCAVKKVSAAIIISAGFREVGEKGKDLENQCAAIAKENGILLLGPNCLGTIDSYSGLNASFAAQKPIQGGISFLSQSGALGTSMLDLAIKEGVGFSKFISLGNEASLTELEFLDFLGKDNNTKAILIYLEKLSNGPEFMRLAKQISRTKPIVLLKAGRSSRGQRAVMSHTGSLAPEDKIFSAACKQSGIIAVESIREFFNLAKLFQLGITKPLNSLVILTNGGGPSVIAADLVDMSRSLSLFELSDATKNELVKVLPTMAAVGNPIDIIGDALSARYEAALKILTEEKKIDGIILMLTPQMMTEVEATANLIFDYGQRKPIIPVFIGGPTIEGGLQVLKAKGLVNFNFPKDAVEALDDLAMGKKKSDNAEEKIATFPRKELGSQMIGCNEMLSLLEGVRISLSGVLLKDKKDIVKALTKIGAGPYAMKAMSQSIVHKTEAGVVKLSISSVEEAKLAWDDIVENVKKNNSEMQGVLIQKMGKGREVIVGMKRDPVFGPTILFGLGGIFTETLKDTSLRVAPINFEDAMEMISEIKGFAILNGQRGERPINLEALADILVKVSQISFKNPEIKEIDLNPVLVSADQASVIDARIMV